jgi:hypothetical protein
MIFRRIKAHVEKENWFAVGIDFVIVVIGVFIGIQVANWNDTRSDREREAQYLENLADDIGEEVGVIEEVLLAQRLRISVIDHMIDEARGEQLPQEIKSSLRVSDISSAGTFSMPPSVDLEGLDQDYFLSYAIMARIFSESSSTFETLQATGDFGLIRDKDLALGIADYYSSVENLVHLENGTIRHIRDEAASIGKRHGLDAFGPNDYDQVVGALREDAEFAAALRTLRNITATNFALAAFAEGEANTLLGQLREVEP